MSPLENNKHVFLSNARTEGGVFFVPSRLLLRVSGKDSLRYLNGQVTADLRKISPENALQACLLTPKGRLVALLAITIEHDTFLIETDALLQDSVIERLERYLVADDVTIEVITPPEIIHCFGKFSEVPEIQRAHGVVTSRLGFSGKDLDAALFSSLSVSTQTKPLSNQLVELLRIEQKIPRWGFELTNETLPPEARLEEDCINYEKGCYLGQEVISRLKSLGHVNRLLYGFISQEEIKPGMEIFSEQEPSRVLGTLTSTALQYDSGRWIALGYLRRGSENALSLFAKNPETGDVAQLHVRKSTSRKN
ncbi:MAG: YgfZ/GcvT domain-containing protein [Chthoniobacterales bacterium]